MPEEFPEFEPLVRNPHLATILGNFWPRDFDFSPFPVERRYFQTDPETQVLVYSQKPAGVSRADLVLVHGLEGGAEAGYMVSLAYRALTAGFAVHRFHMRTCGGTAHLCQTLYHAGLTGDLRAFVQSLCSRVFLAGFSLGGNVCLKLAGELEGSAPWLGGVASVSAPIDLALAARRIGQADNWLYERRFVSRMRARILETGRYLPEHLRDRRTLYGIDDGITAPSFGFDGADHYYATQSSAQVLHKIRVPALLITAQDDTFVPFEMYRNPAIRESSFCRLLAPRYGGHLGFLSRRSPRFWVDAVITQWLESLNPVKGL